MIAPFRRLSPSQIDRLENEQLLAYVIRARSEGATAAADEGVHHLVHRHLDVVRAKVRAKLPFHLVDDVTHDVMVEALRSTFDGEHHGQFVNWLLTVTRRYIADFYRGRAGKQVNLDKEGAALIAPDGNPTVERASLDDTTLETDEIVEQVLAARSPVHREVVDLYVVVGYSAKEVADRTGESDANVFQIAKRFRDDLRDALQAAENPFSPEFELPET